MGHHGYIQLDSSTESSQGDLTSDSSDVEDDGVNENTVWNFGNGVKMSINQLQDLDDGLGGAGNLGTLQDKVKLASTFNRKVFEQGLFKESQKGVSDESKYSANTGASSKAMSR